MTRRMVVECGVAETRFALLQGDEVVRFWFGPARGDEDLARPAEAGDVYLGRVRKVAKSLHGAFIDLGEHQDGFLPFKDKPPIEGAALLVGVRRPALGCKGAVLSETSRIAGAEGLSPPARLNRLDDSARYALRDVSAADLDHILIDSGEAAAFLRTHWNANGPELLVATDVFADSGAEDALEEALERIAPLDGGGRLVFDETEAATFVDVDSGSMSDGGSPRLNDVVNRAAADRIFLQLSRRGIAGKILVDFLPSSNAAARSKLLERLEKRKAGIVRGKCGRLNADGMFDFTAPKSAPSLLERATEPFDIGLLRPGRRFTLAWSARSAVRATCRALEEDRSARVMLFAEPELQQFLELQPRWIERMAKRFGGRSSIVADPKLESCGFHVSKRTG